MTKAISMAIELDQDIMVTHMCVKFGEDWTNSFQELDRKQSSGRTYVHTRATLYAATLWGHKKSILTSINSLSLMLRFNKTTRVLFAFKSSLQN